MERFEQGLANKHAADPDWKPISKVKSAVLWEQVKSLTAKHPTMSSDKLAKLADCGVAHCILNQARNRIGSQSNDTEWRCVNNHITSKDVCKRSYVISGCMPTINQPTYSIARGLIDRLGGVRSINTYSVERQAQYLWGLTISAASNE